MIDIQLLRADIGAVAKRLSTRGYTLDVARLQALEEKRRQIQTATEQLQVAAQRARQARSPGQGEEGRSAGGRVEAPGRPSSGRS